jgi:AcrR family transcriptional regulator
MIAPGKVAQRREAKASSIVAAAWRLARENGVAGLSLHALARDLGMRQPSLYEYFDSKHALFDAMFADGNRQLLERFDNTRLPRDPRAALKKFLRTFIEFSIEDRARSALLFQRHIPGFIPSPASYALAEEVLARAVKLMHEAGVNGQGDVDCMVAMVSGLIEAQIANDPGGTRWIRHLDRLVDLYVDDALARSKRR